VAEGFEDASLDLHVSGYLSASTARAVLSTIMVSTL
jgi:hypothetical protein